MGTGAVTSRTLSGTQGIAPGKPGDMFEIHRTKGSYFVFWFAVFLTLLLIIFSAVGIYFIHQEIEGTGDDVLFWWILVLLGGVNAGLIFLSWKVWEKISATPIMLRLDGEGIHYLFEDIFMPWADISRVKHTVLAVGSVVVGDGFVPGHSMQAFIVEYGQQETVIGFVTDQKNFTAALEFMSTYLPAGCHVEPLHKDGEPYVIDASHRGRT